MTQNHTPEPWVPSEAKNATGVILGGPKRSLHNGSTTQSQIASACLQEWMTPGERDANARRIVACVNACEGMEDPAALIAGLRSELQLATHKLLTCGVAARHPDASLSRRESDYGGKWNSPQAESVRQLRQQRDQLQAQVDELLEELTITLGSLKEICSVRQIPRPESTIRRAESAIKKTTGETK